ncbi:hypothetical protein BpHYR1_012041 [Brachionus plicatilis]|uniref:Uncharacterized protein n=1 Tax=Brachionus plicatilis TaxID=10195 RepID=A0A3M7SVA2_BRAPC|nr:hypothetical protein BpHYR1_012041 [Brachionus plicatilis]
MTLPEYGLYSSYKLSNDQLLNRSIKFKQQSLIKEHMALYYMNKKAPKANRNVIPISTNNWRDDEIESVERERAISRTGQKNSAISGIKVIGKSLMTDNEIRKVNQNNVHEKLLNLKKKDLDSQLKYNLTKIKREKSILIEKYIDLQAKNFKFIQNIESRNMSRLSEPRKINLSSLSTSGVFSPSLFARSVQSAPAKMRRLSHVSFDLFKAEQSDLESRLSSAYDSYYEHVPHRLTLKTPQSYQSHLDKIKEKFVDQKLRFNSSVKKKRKNKHSMTLQDLDRTLAQKKGACDSCLKKRTCSKFKHHKLAEHNAEIYLSNKLLNKLNAFKISEKQVEFKGDQENRI